MKRVPRAVVCAAVRVYQLLGSPLLSALFGRACRFKPSCSEYAFEAIHTHGVVRGGRLATTRLLRCRPGGDFGYEPVPPVLEARKTGGRSVRE